MPDIYDGPWRLFEYDAATGRSTWSRFDGDRIHWRVDTPVDELLEANAEAERASHGRRFGEWRRVASIPLDHYHYSGLQEAGLQGDKAFVRRWMNDADNRKFRTSRGKV